MSFLIYKLWESVQGLKLSSIWREGDVSHPIYFKHYPAASTAWPTNCVTSRVVSCCAFKVWIWQWCIYKLHKKSFIFLFIEFSYLKISKIVMVLTFLGYSSSPNPYRGSTENAVIIQEVIVSGTVFLSATLPSTLYFVQMQIILYPSK